MDHRPLEIVKEPHVSVRVEVLGSHGTTWFPSVAALEAVRANFNPSGMSSVDLMKALAAGFIDMARTAGEISGDTRSAAIAITQIEQACMWAVKAATFKKLDTGGGNGGSTGRT